MIPDINLPINTTIFEPNIKELVSLKDKEIDNILIENGIKSLIEKQKTLVIINDAQRSTPSYKILKSLNRISQNHNITDLIVASGTHVPPNEKELDNLLRNTNKELKCKVNLHNAKSANFLDIGQTQRGTIIKINPILKEFRQVLCINSVEPHFFAGFTGGIKSIIPGLAAKSTVEKNHSWALHKDSGPTLLDNNPLQIDLWEAGEKVSETLDIKYFGIQMVNKGDQIYFLAAGELKSAFRKTVEEAKKVYAIHSEKKFDVILSIVYPPLNRSLYQAQKGIENTRQILKRGGEMILFADCPNGIGNDAFFETLKKYSDPDQVIDDLNQENYRFGDHKAYKFATLAKNNKLIIVSNLSISETKRVFATNLTLNNLENHLTSLSKEGKSIAVIIDSGTLTVYN